MPDSDVRAHLKNLYAASDDPWSTCSSPYEQGKFVQTIACLPRPRYKLGLEVGCGVGALSVQLARRCDMLIAMDCTDQAVRTALAQNDLTNVSFFVGEAPRDWPDHPPRPRDPVRSAVFHDRCRKRGACLAAGARLCGAVPCRSGQLAWRYRQHRRSSCSTKAYCSVGGIA